MVEGYVCHPPSWGCLFGECSPLPQGSHPHHAGVAQWSERPTQPGAEASNCVGCRRFKSSPRHVYAVNQALEDSSMEAVGRRAGDTYRSARDGRLLEVRAFWRLVISLKARYLE